MTKINNYNEYAELQKRYPRTLSNDFLMPDEVRKLIEYDKLSYIADESGLFTFIEREGFCKLVFRLTKHPSRENSVPPSLLKRALNADEPLAAYLVYREDKPPKAAAEWLMSQGFSHSVRLERWVCRGAHCASADKLQLCSPADHPVGYRRHPSTEGKYITTAAETYEFLHQYFGAEEMDLPPRDMFQIGDALCVRAEDGSLVGVIYDMGHTRIIAVSPAARGQGLGVKLYRAFMKNAASDGKIPTLYEWIRPDNASSIAMFKKLGFEKDTLVTDCYINKGAI